MIPAAGRATRLGGFPCSKEVLPIGYSASPPATGPQPPTLAAHGLLTAFRVAGISTALVALGDGKWDVPTALGDGSSLGLRIGYVPVSGSRSVPESLDRLRAFTDDRVCALGFPDVWFHPEDAFARVIAARRDAGAEIGLGCFPTDLPQRTDMVELDPSGEVLRIDVRPAASELAYNWLIAVWGPTFSEFLHRQVTAAIQNDADGELQLGELFRRAHADGMRAVGVPFPKGSFTDLGTPGELGDAWRRGHPLPS